MNYQAFQKALRNIINFTSEEFEKVAPHFALKKLKKKEIWEQAGKISGSMGFVNKGILRQYYLKDGVEYTTDFFVENEFIGNYISYQNQQASQTITVALEQCELLVIPFAQFEQLYALFPATEAASKVVGNQKLLALQERNASLLTNTPEERYYKLVEQKPDLIHRVPQYLIAQYLGIRPESLSRIRKRHFLNQRQ